MALVMFAFLYPIFHKEDAFARWVRFVVGVKMAVKAIRQKHNASPDLLRLWDEFRRMVNVCIAIGIQENISSLKAGTGERDPNPQSRWRQAKSTRNDNLSDENLAEPQNRIKSS
jgi:hypothetical protein